MTNGDKVIAAFRKRLGVSEKPPGSNDDGGGWITHVNGRWNMRFVPWCGTSSDAAYAEAKVDDGALGSPSTWQIVENGRREGRLRDKPVPGCYIVWRPGVSGHVEIAVRALTTTAWRTIGGNTGDAVREHDRYIIGAFFVVPKALEEKPAPVFKTYYWWEDPKARPEMHGPWATISARDKAARLWVERNGNPGHIRRGKFSKKVNGRWVPRFAFWTGPRKRSPAFDSKAKRDADLKKVAAQRPGHTLRKRSKRLRVSS